MIRSLGQGATSRVYLAYDMFRSQQVAIKVMQASSVPSEGARRLAQRAFLTEAALVGKLKHPHIVSIHDAVSEGDENYIVMDYVGGGTLEQHCRQDKLLPVDRVIEVMFVACTALNHAHQQGVIHCDVKPANLLLDQNRELKVSDFGAAQYIAAAHTQLSRVGSPLYMSPEQIEDMRLNHQTDIYSLGAVVYQLLTGRPPFYGSSHDSLLYQILRVEPEPPSLARPQLSPELDRIILRALAKSREDRYADWQELAADLERLFDDLRIPDQDLSEAERFSVLRQLPLFRGFGDVEIWEALRIGTWHRLRGGTTLIREGETCRSFFVIAEGEVVVSRTGRSLGSMGEGQIFGDILYFEDRSTPRATTITSASPVVLLEIAAESLRRASAACQARFERALLRTLLEKVERLPDGGAAAS